MSIIAFEFDDSTLRAVVGQRPNRQFRVTGTFEIPIDGDVESIGQKLKEELRNHGINKASATVVLSRWQSEIREITVPPVPDDELPDLVRFQAKNEFISLTEEWPLDYIRLDQPDDGPHRVLAAAISPKMLEHIRAICRAAEITLKHIVLQPLAIVNLFSDKQEAGEQIAQLLIRSSSDRADLSIAVNGNLKITRSIRFAPDAAAEKRSSLLISESRRTLAAASPILDTPIKHATVLGHEKRFKALGGDLTKGLGFTVDFVDAFDLLPLSSQFVRPEHSADFAAVLGSLASQNTSAKHAVDFLSPKRKVVRHPERNRWLAIGGLALAASLLLIIFGWTSLSSKQQKIDDLTETLDRYSTNNAGDGQRPGVDQIVGEVGAIDQWKLKDVNWLVELKQLSDRMLTPDDIIVDSLTASAGRGTPQLDMNSRVASVPKENELLASLGGRPYQLTPERSEEKSDKDYPLGLNLRASYQPDMTALIQEINVRAAEFLEKQQEQQLQQQQKQAVSAEASP
jgi:hypothetical protein